MKTILDAASRDRLIKRFEQLRPDSRPKWGQMDAPRMLAHVADPMRAAMGEMTVAPKKGPLRNPVLRWLIIYVLPWPKGAPTAPEFLRREETDLQYGRNQLRQTMDRFVRHSENGKLSPHPAFGDLSRKDWGTLQHRHIDHHLRQFGL